MAEYKFREELCDDCGQPLFLDKEECRAFIENRMKQGYIVCSCCGSRKEAGKPQ